MEEEKMMMMMKKPRLGRYPMGPTTNIGARFLSLIDKCFPKDGPLGKVFNR